MAQHAQEDTIDEVGEEGEPELPLKQKVAIVMVAMGEEVSGEVMKHLADYEIEEITQAIAGLKNVSVDIMDRLLEEFEQHIMAGEWISQGGLDFARQALERAVGPRKAQEMLDRISSQISSGFYMLRNVPPDQIAQDPEVAEAVRNLMFVFDDISKLTDREIQTLMREVDDLRLYRDESAWRRSRRGRPLVAAPGCRQGAGRWPPRPVHPVRQTRPSR